MAEFAWRWRRLDGAGSDGDRRGMPGRFWVPDGYLDGVTGPYLRRMVERLIRQWQHAPLADLGDRPPARLAVEGDVPPEKLPRPHVRSVPLASGHLRLEVTSRWPPGSLTIPDGAREALGEALSCSDIPAEFWRYLPWGTEACPAAPPWPSAPPVLCRPCGERRLRSLIVMLGREPLWGAFCDRCCTVYWTRREAVVASVEVDLRPRAQVRPLPGTVTIGGREVPARVVEVTYDPPAGPGRTDFELELAVAAARDRIARGEARPEDTDATLFWSRPRRPRPG